MSEQELEPCPFCGKNTGYIKKIVVSIDWIIYTSYCENRLCEASLGSNNRTYDTPEEATAAWNTRPIENALRAKMRELEAENARIQATAQETIRLCKEAADLRVAALQARTAALREIRLIAIGEIEIMSDRQKRWNGKELYQIAKKAEAALNGEVKE